MVDFHRSAIQRLESKDRIISAGPTRLLLLPLLVSCSRPAVGPLDSDSGTSSAGHTGIDSGDSDTDIDTDTSSDSSMVKGLFIPMGMDVEQHPFAEPHVLAEMGFNSLALLQYVLISPDGVVMEGWTEEEITARVQSYQEAGLAVSVGLGVGYSETGDPDDLFSATNYPSIGIEPGPVLEVMSDYMVDMVPLAETLGVRMLFVNEADLFFYETRADESLDFSTVSAWSQQFKSDLEDAGWGDEEDELILWKTGYSYVPFLEDGIYTDIQLDMDGFDMAGFSITPDDKNFDADLDTWAAGYRSMVDRFVADFAAAMPDETVLPAVTEFGAWDAACGFWNATPDTCERYWTEEHLAAAYSTVFDSIAEWNATQEPKFRGVFPMSSPLRSGQFTIATSTFVQDTIADGMAQLDETR
jgi:hypothetical protein